MAREVHASSIFAQSLDRPVFAAYFLGAVVPLLALAILAQHYVIPTLDGKFAAVGLVGIVLSIGALSLGAFLMLRRTTRHALVRLDDHNLRLSELLKVSKALSTAAHGAEVASTAVKCAQDMTGARATYLLTRSDGDSRLTVREAAGENTAELFTALPDSIYELMESAASGNRPAMGTAALKNEKRSSAVVVVPIEGQVAPVGVMLAVRPASAGSFDAAQVSSLVTLASLTSVALRNGDLHDAQRNFFTYVTDLLVTALDTHLPDQAGHGRRVAEYANRVGRLSGLDEASLQRLHFAALLHDIGMLKIDRSMHHSRSVCLKHPEIGARMLSRIQVWEDVAPLVLHHHEHFDGSGYPQGLAGQDIPHESRIIAVVESFDAMTSNSSYRSEMSVEDAVAELKACAGSQFDPKVVETTLELIEQGVIAPKPPS